METLDIDEMMAQLLVAEGFVTLEEVAYVDADELLSIDGFDEGTAGELQTRAREYLEAANTKAMEAAKALGIEDSLVNFEGLTPQMLEALAKDGIKTLEDFATCADWELAGGWTTEKGQRVKDEGVLEKFDVSLEEAQNLVMTARVMLGWVDPTELESAEEDDDAGHRDRQPGEARYEGLFASERHSRPPGRSRGCKNYFTMPSRRCQLCLTEPAGESGPPEGRASLRSRR